MYIYVYLNNSLCILKYDVIYIYIIIYIYTCVTSYIHTIPYHTIPYHTIPYHTIPYHTTPYHTIPYHTIPYIHITYIYIYVYIHVYIYITTYMYIIYTDIHIAELKYGFHDPHNSLARWPARFFGCRLLSALNVINWHHPKHGWRYSSQRYGWATIPRYSTSHGLWMIISDIIKLYPSFWWWYPNSSWQWFLFHQLINYPAHLHRLSFKATSVSLAVSDKSLAASHRVFEVEKLDTKKKTM